MVLTLLEIVMATFSIIIIFIFAIVGIRVALSYKKTKERVYILVGLTWIGIIEAWIPSAIVLIGYLMGNPSILLPQTYFLIAIVGYPITTIIWFTAFTDLLYKHIQKIIQLIVGICETIFELVFIYFLFTDIKTIATFKSPVDVAYGPLVSIYIFICLISILSTGLLISIKSIKGSLPENKIRGYFLFFALITLFIGGLLDAGADLNLLGVVLVRLFVISSAIEFYIAFVLPNFIKRVFKVKP
jgi:hypothetical protein